RESLIPHPCHYPALFRSDLQAWKDFAKSGIKLINRETGAGARVLLDEQLRLNGISRNQVNGYDDIQTSHMGVASAVANGRADVGDRKSTRLNSSHVEISY